MSYAEHFKKALTIDERIERAEKNIAYLMDQVEWIIDKQLDTARDDDARRERMKQCQELLDTIRTMK